MFCLNLYFYIPFLSVLRIKLLIWSQTEVLLSLLSAGWFLFYFLKKSVLKATILVMILSFNTHDGYRAVLGFQVVK